MNCHKKTGMICSHPHLFPSQWEQKRPAPAEILECDGGCCRRCPVCGYGGVAFPCRADKKELNKKEGSAICHY